MTSAAPPSRQGSYLPALRFAALTRFYDPVLGATLKETKLKRLLVEQAALRAGQRVLDVGCGTATLTILVKKVCPGAEVIGLDADPEILAQAERKAHAAGVDIQLHQGLAAEPPFEQGTFDRVVSSLMFHHLTTSQKRDTLRSIRGLLRPGGELHVADWGRAQNWLMRVAFLGVQVLDGFETTADNVAGRLPDLMREAGFTSVSETHREMTMLGTLSLYKAVSW